MIFLLRARCCQDHLEPVVTEGVGFEIHRGTPVHHGSFLENLDGVGVALGTWSMTWLYSLAIRNCVSRIHVASSEANKAISTGSCLKLRL